MHFRHVQRQGFHNCFGSFIFPSGNEYVGEWKDDKRHGHGASHSSMGGHHVGEYRDGKPNGHGTYTWADGDKLRVSTRTASQMATVLTHGPTEISTSVSTRTVNHGKESSILRLARRRRLTQTASRARAVSRLPGNWH